MTDLEFNNVMSTARDMDILDNVTAAFGEGSQTWADLHWAQHLAWAASLPGGAPNHLSIAIGLHREYVLARQG